MTVVIIPSKEPEALAGLTAKLPTMFLPDEKTAERFFGFFTANIRNPHTRRAYYNAACRLADCKEILRESELGVEEILAIDAVLPDIVRDTLKAESSSLKLKRIMGKLGKAVCDPAIKVITDIASKKALGLR